MAQLGTWKYQFKLTLDKNKINGGIIVTPLIDFPVLVRLGAQSGISKADTRSIFNELANNSLKLAITTDDGISQCSVEVAQWDTVNQEARLWVKVPSVSSQYDTVLYLYYDNSQPDNTSYVGRTNTTPAESVWDSNFVAVYHLEEIGNGTPGEYKDSTYRHHHGRGGAGNPARTPTKAAWGQFFDPRTYKQYIEIPDHNDFSIIPANAMTVTLWFAVADLNNPTVPSPSEPGKYTYYQPFGKGASGTHEWMIQWYPKDVDAYSGSARSQEVSNYVFNPSGGLGAGDTSRGAYGIGEWVRIIAEWFCSSPTVGDEKIYRNDMVYSGRSDTWQSYGLTYANGPEPVRIGMQHDTSWSGAMYGWFAEVRFSNIVRSIPWERASYQSESDNLVTFQATNQPMLVVTVSATLGGTTNPQPGIYNVVSGGSLSIQAVANLGWYFVGWAGSVSGTQNPLTLGGISSDLSVTAQFSQTPPQTQVGGGLVLGIAVLTVLAIILARRIK